MTKLLDWFPDVGPNRSWLLFRKRDIPNPERTATYMRRYYLVNTPWFGLYVHDIREPDADRHLHNHPWDFAVFVLDGGYLEELPNDQRAWRRPGSLRIMRANQYHRIAAHTTNRTWSLFARGPAKQNWGFEVDGDFIPHQVYLKERT